MAYEPTFAEPPCVITFSSEEEFRQFLLDHQVPYWEWGEEVRSKAWTEIVEGDAVYSVGHSHGQEVAIRCICVVSARVMMSHPEHGWLVLIEYKFNSKTNQYEPRRSLSEKMLLGETGEPVETPVQTIARCFQQETGISTSIDELSGGVMAFLPQDFIMPEVKVKQRPLPRGFGIGAIDVEKDFSPSSKFPHLWTFRQVAKYTVELDACHYRPTGWQDPGTRYYSKWRSVHSRKALQPIPAEAIKRKRAVA